MIRDYIVEGTEPPDAKTKKDAEIVQAIYPIILEEMSMKAIEEKIVSLRILRPGSIRRYVALAERVYGRVSKADAAGRRNILVELALAGLKEATKEKAYASMHKFIDQVAKLEGLYKTEDNMEGVFQSLELPDVEISSDPSALESADLDVEVDE